MAKKDTDPQAFLLAMLHAMEARLTTQGRAGLPPTDPSGFISPGTFRRRLKAWRAIRAEDSEESDGTEQARTRHRPRRKC